MVPLLSLPASEAGRQTSDSNLRRLAASLAHNINNPLTGVIGYLELALRETNPETPSYEHLQRSLACAQRVAEMIRRVVAFAFQPAGQGGLTPVSLRRLAEQFVRFLGQPHSLPGVQIALDATSDALIRANTPLLQLVLEQVINNALEAMPHGGTLSFRVGEEDSCCRLSIQDSGGGMSAEVQAHLFEPFFTTKCSGHLGLGLALSRDVVEALGGRLRVQSAEGQGTIVTLLFPSAAEARVEDLPIDERIGLLLASRSAPVPGPHFSRAPTPPEPLLAGYAI